MSARMGARGLESNVAVCHDPGSAYFGTGVYIKVYLQYSKKCRHLVAPGYMKKKGTQGTANSKYSRYIDFHWGRGFSEATVRLNGCMTHALLRNPEWRGVNGDVTSTTSLLHQGHTPESVSPATSGPHSEKSVVCILSSLESSILLFDASLFWVPQTIGVVRYTEPLSYLGTSREK